MAPSPAVPPCTVVNGTPAVTFSRDGGKTLAPVAQKLSGIAYANGLAVLDAATLLLAQNTTLSLSTDGGCNWRVIGDVVFDDPFPPFIAAAGRNRAYIWADGRAGLARYADGAIAALKPPVDIAGLGADRANGERLRIGGKDGTLWESIDGGASWRLLAAAPVSNAFVYRAAFDPANLDHAVFGFMAGGAAVTFNAGKSYASSRGFESPSNVFNVAVSPADPNTVWAMALATLEPDPQGRHIYLSRDGGTTFTPVIDAGAGVTLINGPLLAPHPADANVLYFVFGTYFDGYGTDLFRYDAATAALTKTHFDYDDFDAIAFSPTDPNLMYFGLEVVRRTQP